MKSLAPVMIVVGAVFLGGCSAPKSAADTCKEFKALAASFSGGPAGMSQESRNTATGKYADLASRSPEALKSDIQIVADYLKVLVADGNAGEANPL
ncbi:MULTISPECIES: hypothetical protein [unclassified Arthrobacter]|uniref:hypothetical protein n=1 Tax=unclassified Pseudarthrobacter TaxID=2647000 RepID=UPI0033957D78